MKAYRISAIISCSIVALAFVAATSVARADTEIVYGTPAENDSTPITNTTNISLAQFNSSLGTLESVEIILSGGGSTVYFANLSVIGGGPIGTGSATIDSFTTDATLTLTGSSPILTMDLTGTDTLSTPIVLNAGNPSTITTAQPIIGSTTDAFPSDLSDYIGIGDLAFALTGTANSSFLGNVTDGYSAGVGGETDAGATVEAIYTYDGIQPPVIPEPGTLTLFGTGLLGLAGLLRRKFMLSR